MTLEARERTPQTQQELFELPLSETFSAWNIRLNGIERERLNLFAEAEHALSEGLLKLSIGAFRNGREIKTDDFRNTVVIRQPLLIPDRNLASSNQPKFVIDFSFPGKLKGLLERIHLEEYSSKMPAEFWFDVPKENYVSLGIGASVGEQGFELTMNYKKQATYYLDPHRPDDDILSFSGTYTKKFERNVDEIKDLNRENANAKLSFAFGMMQLVSELKAPSPNKSGA